MALFPKPNDVSRFAQAAARLDFTTCSISAEYVALSQMFLCLPTSASTNSFSDAILTRAVKDAVSRWHGWDESIVDNFADLCLKLWHLKAARCDGTPASKIERRKKLVVKSAERLMQLATPKEMGRPNSTAGMGKFVAERQSRNPRMILKAIRSEWNAAHPEHKATESALRGARDRYLASKKRQRK